MSAVKSLMRKETRSKTESLNIITFSFDFNYESGIAKTGHNLYYWTTGYQFSWGVEDSQSPRNFIKLPPDIIPSHVAFDLILCPNRGIYNLAMSLAKTLHVPLICLEHDYPDANFKNQNVKDWRALSMMEGDINVFSSKQCRDGWEKMGYVVEPEDKDFTSTWDSILKQASEIIYAPSNSL
jgi:hypothetical protein